MFAVGGVHAVAVQVAVAAVKQPLPVGVTVMKHYLHLLNQLPGKIKHCQLHLH
jgi:hypothetical protein